MSELIFSLDCESIGLLGDIFWVGWSIWQDDKLKSIGQLSLERNSLSGTAADFAWVSEHIPPLEDFILDGKVARLFQSKSPIQLRELFWETWEQWEALGAVLLCDSHFPVESRFLLQCLADDPRRKPPYPILDLPSILKERGLNPLGTYERLPFEILHNPIGDSMQTARLYFTAGVSNAHSV